MGQGEQDASAVSNIHIRDFSIYVIGKFSADIARAFHRSGGSRLRQAESFQVGEGAPCSKESKSGRLFCIFSGISGFAGVLMLIVSFSINPGPPQGASQAELIKFAAQFSHAVLVGAWLQTVGPAFIVMFAFALVHLGRAAATLTGWMTFFGAIVLMMVSLIEITFYIGALHVNAPFTAMTSLELIYSLQHLYFIVGAPALFVPLGIVLFRSRVLPRIFSYHAFLVGGGFSMVGMASLFTLTLPPSVTSLGSLRAVWWLAAAVTLIVRSRKLARAGCA